MCELNEIKSFLVNEMIAASDYLMLRRFEHTKSPSIQTAVAVRLAAAQLQVVKDELASMQNVQAIAA